MNDLSSMIDDTTERLFRKIDNWEIPQTDKKYIAIEKEVWESTLNRSMVLEAENAQLKELLKECRYELDGEFGIGAANLVEEIDEVLK